jgi:hypothetical protein
LIAAVAELVLERARQDAKWGEQNPPNLSPELSGLSTSAVASDMGIPSAHSARQSVENLAERKALGYADIALEEFCEAIEAAAEGDDAHLREELIQTAAVLVAWVECIDRRKARGTP